MESTSLNGSRPNEGSSFGAYNRNRKYEMLHQMDGNLWYIVYRVDDLNLSIWSIIGLGYKLVTNTGRRWLFTGHPKFLNK